MKKRYILLRLAVFILLMFLIVRPAKKIYRADNALPVAVVFDESESMGKIISARAYADARGKIVSYITGNKKLRPVYFAFSGDLRKIFYDDINKIKPSGGRTDIAGALEKVNSEFLGRGLDAVLLVTDGNQNAGGEIGGQLEEYKNLGIPVFAIAPKRPEDIKNIAVADVSFPDIIFRNTVSTVTVKINCVGFAGKKIPVFLKSGGKVLYSKTVDVAADGPLFVPFEIKPSLAGVNSYSAEVPTYRGEKIFSDNAKNFSLNVEPEKIRVLYLCGQPSFNYSFLRATLKNDPNVELVTFVILRNPENIVAVADGELSLIPFPVDEIFSKEIFNFDVIILENFNYSRFAISQQHLANIKNIVYTNGKALLFISGEVPLSVYQNTPLDEILPVDAGREIVVEPFKLDVLLPEHGVMRLSDNPSDNARLWSGMPVLDGFNLATPRSKTVVLAESSKYKKPIVAVAEKGKGRVMCVLTSSFWRLALGGESPYNYTRFWGQSVKWLINAPSMKQVALFLKNSYSVNDTASIKIRVKNEYSKPVDNAVVLLAVTRPNGQKEAFQVPPSNNTGEYEIGLDLPSPGGYRLDANASFGRRQLGSDSAYFSVNDVSLESGDITVNEPLLKEIAAATGGGYFTADALPRSGFDIKPRNSKADVLYEINIWSKPVIFILIVILLFVEWFLRRRSGML